MEPQSSLSSAAGQPFRGSTLNQKKAPRVIAVTSGRGGVGKSCLVVNLGLTLTRLGKKVLVLDADRNAPNIAFLLGLTVRHTISDVFTGTTSLADAISNGPEGLKILPGAPERPEVSELSRAQKLFLLDELDACADQFDFLLVDAGAGTSNNVMYFNSGAQERILVADQEPASITDAYSLIKILATRYAEKRFKLLFNKITRPEAARRSYEQLTKVADRFLCGSISLEYMGIIPYDEAIPQSVRLQQACVDIAPDAPASLSLVQIAQGLLFHEPQADMNGNIKFFWQSLNRRATVTFSPGVPHESQLR